MWHRVRYDATGCWVWTGATANFGYGLVSIGGRQERAHRVAWAMFNGPIPEGLKVIHTCDNPPCCRPDHLRVGTQWENMEDMTRKGRRRHGTSDQRGSKNGYAKLTEEQVAHIKGMAAAGHYQDDIAARFGVTRANVSYATRKTWTHVEPIPYPPAVRDRPVGRGAPAKRAARAS